MTNADKVKNMKTEELASMIIDMGCTRCEEFIGECLLKAGNQSCQKVVAEWLESEEA